MSCESRLQTVTRELALARAEVTSLRALMGLAPTDTCVADELPDACQAIRADCKGDARCIKAALTHLLPSSERVAVFRRTHRISASWYFLCLPAAQMPDLPRTPKVEALTALLRRARTEELARAQYARATQLSAMAALSASERAAHYLSALVEERPDDLHAVDRLAIALGESASGGGGGGSGSGGGGADEDGGHGGGEADVGARARARSLLLHYAMLRRLLVHPEQRPLQPSWFKRAARTTDVAAETCLLITPCVAGCRLHQL